MQRIPDRVHHDEPTVDVGLTDHLRCGTLTLLRTAKR